MLSISLVTRGAMLKGVTRSQLLPFNPSAFRMVSTSAVRSAPKTESLSFAENITLLNTQRLKRPNSPHFTIYQPQMTWIPSIFNRFTGVGMSVVMYAGAIAYIFHPMFPVIDSAHLIDLSNSIHPHVKTTLKFILALPFTFHSINGVRHLLWDVGRLTSVKAVTSTSYIVIGASIVSSAILSQL